MSKISPEQWQQLSPYLSEVLALPETERAAWLDSFRDKDAKLAGQLEALLADHQALKQEQFLEQNPSLGSMLGPYQLLSPIGAGGMGEVYRARDTRLDRTVAIKILPHRYSTDPAARQRFEREAKAISALQHPNICTLHDVGRQGNTDYIVMEFLEGQTLAAFLSAGPVPGEKIVRWAIEIADALDTAHRRGIIHRDLKPANIFVTSRGECKVLDFGLAKIGGDESLMDTATSVAKSNPLTTPGVAMGTVAYMSPEQARGEALDARTDIFSLGAILYEMATGKLAFPGPTWAVIFKAILDHTPPRPTESNPTIPSPLDDIVAKALEKDRDLRYQSAADLCSDLKRLQRDTNSGRVLVASGRTAATSTAAKRSQTRKLIVGIVAAVVIAGAAAYAYHSRSVETLSNHAPLYVSEFTNSTDDSVFDDVLRDIVARELNRSSDVQVVDLEPGDVVDSLQHLGKGLEERFTPELARQVCQKYKGQAFTEGKIGRQGAGYLLELTVRKCGSGRVVTQARGEAKNKNDVMRAAGQLAADARVQLSRKPASSQNDTPLQPPTASLPAYKAYVTADRFYDIQWKQSDDMLHRAVELDPNFADAWNLASFTDLHLGEFQQSTEDLKHAFALREHLPENEAASVESRYYLEATGELYKAVDSLQSWEKLQPREFSAHNLLGLAYEDLGLYEKATDELRRNSELFPNEPIALFNYSDVLRAQGRYDEAEIVQQRIPTTQQLGPHDHWTIFLLAKLRLDQKTLARERQWMEENADQPFVLDGLVIIDISEGRMERARQRTQHCVSESVGSGLSEFAALTLLDLAHAEALYGNRSASTITIAQALKLSDSKDTKIEAARVMALNGQEKEALRAMDGLLLAYPSATLLNEVDAPLVLAAQQLSSGQGEKAMQTLERVKPFEFGRSATYLPDYLRALVDLRLRRPEEANAEFAAILSHRGVSPLGPTLVVAQIGLARTFALQGDRVKARAAYDTFLTNWKDADPDIPILKQAQAEYTKLR